jgi:hypothetical protein
VKERNEYTLANIHVDSKLKLKLTIDIIRPQIDIEIDETDRNPKRRSYGDKHVVHGWNTNEQSYQSEAAGQTFNDYLSQPFEIENRYFETHTRK